MKYIRKVWRTDYAEIDKTTDKFKKWYVIYLLLAVCFILFLMSILPQGSSYEVASEVKNIHIKGEYSINQQPSGVPFDNYSEIDCKGWPEIYIRGNVNNEIPAGEEILIYVYQESIELKVNDQVIYSSSDDESSRWDYVKSPGIKKSDKIELHMYQRGREQYEDAFKTTYSRLYQGNRYALMQKEFMKNLSTIILSGMIVITGLSVVLATIVLFLLKVPMLEGYFSCGMLMVVGGICCFINYDYITLLFPAAIVVNVIDFTLQLAIALFLMLYLKSYMNNEQCRRIASIVVYIWTLVMCMYFMLYIVKLEDSLIVNGSLVMTGLAVMAILLITLCVDYYLYENEQAGKVLFSGIMLTICTLIEMLHYYLSHIWWINVFLIGVFLFTLAQLAILIKRSKESILKVKQAETMEKELLTSRINQMSHQIRPHFVYNVLTTISCLCETNPTVARDMADEFSDYLRVNVDSMNYTEPISFQQELANMNTYYSLEKIRFENKMDISWIIEEDDFTIPALTIEPLVENAIKHGVNYKDGILHIVVSTRSFKNYIEVTVEDDGPGFDVNEKKDDGREHVGLINIRKRLDLMSHASMAIESEPGKGTKVTIKIPKQKRRIEDENIGDR